MLGRAGQGGFEGRILPFKVLDCPALLSYYIFKMRSQDLYVSKFLNPKIRPQELRNQGSLVHVQLFDIRREAKTDSGCKLTEKRDRQ
jgi:hypothetical protein